jgi:hypothetical protein
MEFLKNHYEKVLLAVVLLGLAVVVGLLPMKIPEAPASETAAPQNPPTPLNLVTNQAALNMLSNLPPLVLSGTNNLFNPVTWRRTQDGSMIKLISDNLIGPGAVIYQKAIPLYFILSYDGVNGSNYIIGVAQEAHKNPNLRSKKLLYVTPNETTEFFKLIQVNGAPDAPSDLSLQLVDTKEVVSISKEKPYKRVTGYLADLKYAPKGVSENLTWSAKRAGDKLIFDGDTNNIVDISSNVVVLSASSTGKRTTLKLNAAP